jgi:iron complex outermembrane receptor protein
LLRVADATGIGPEVFILPSERHGMDTIFGGFLACAKATRIKRGRAAAPILAVIGAFGWCVASESAYAQGTSLPAITVDAPKPKKARPAVAISRPARTQIAAIRPQRRAPRAPVVARPRPILAATPGATGPALPASGVAGLASADPHPLQQAPQGGKTGTKLEDLPTSIQIVSGQTVREQGGTNLDAAIRNSSGISQGGGDGFGFAERFLIRGLNPQIFSDGNSEGDQRNGIAQSINGVDHIEIIKGPGSALLGSGPPGGSINIVHFQPLPILAYGGSVQFGSFNALTTNLYATGPTTAAPGLNFRVDGQVQHTDGFRGLHKGDYEFRPVLSWDLGGHLMTLSVDARHLTSLPDPAGIVYFHGLPANVSRDTLYSTPFGHVTQDYVRTTFSDVWSAADYVTVNNRFSYMHRTQDILRNGDGSTAVGLSETGRQLRAQSDRFDDFDYQFEPIWKFKTAGIGHTLLTGIEARYQSLFANRATADLPVIGNIFAPAIPETSISGLNFIQDAKHSGFTDNLNATYLSAYAVDQVDVTEKLKVRLSGRYDHWDTDLTPQTFVPGRIFQGAQIFQPGVTYQRLDNPLSWSAGALYKILPGVSPFVGVSSSHLANFSSEATSAAIHDPESALQFEAGVKVATYDDRVVFTVAAFDVKRNNVFTLVGDSFVFNNQKTRGIEADAQILITPQWKLQGNVTIQAANLTNNLSAPAADGNQPIGVPLHIANLWTTYDFAIGDLKGFKVGAGLTYRDKIFADALNTTLVPAYTLFDAILTYSQPHWDASIGIKNIADKRYFVNANGAGAFVGDPRTVFAKVDVHF